LGAIVPNAQQKVPTSLRTGHDRRLENMLYQLKFFQPTILFSALKGL